MRSYEYKLKFPVEFIPHEFENNSKFHEITLPKKFINQEFLDFLYSLNIDILYGRHFYAFPNQFYVYHRDIKIEEQDTIFDSVSINFARGAIGSEMIWYELKEGANPIYIPNFKNKIIMTFKKDDLIEMQRASIGWPSLVDTYAIHSMQNVNEPRECWSITLKKLDTQQRLTWAEAEEIFKDYFL